MLCPYERPFFSTPAAHFLPISKYEYDANYSLLFLSFLLVTSLLSTDVVIFDVLTTTRALAQAEYPPPSTLQRPAIIPKLFF